jgi:glycerophosphoryl diester phosphodiesterase
MDADRFWIHMTKARNGPMSKKPLIIAHRGACGYLPEHTLESYQRAIDLGADMLETDVVLTRDGHLICRHDCELSATTNVAAHAEFESRRRIKKIDGRQMQGWFVEDFTREEIRTMRARERFDFRDHSHDDQFAIPTLRDLLDFAAKRQTRAGKPVGVIVEIKHATYFDSLSLPMDTAVKQALEEFSLTGPDSKAWVESFEFDVLKRLRRVVNTPLIQLLDGDDYDPPDVVAAGGLPGYQDRISPMGLAEIARYASAVGVWKRMIVSASGSDPRALKLHSPTSLIADAHAAGLEVHAYTFRNEPQFLAADYQRDPAQEYAHFAALGVDGFITDFPDEAKKFVDRAV